MWIFLNDGSTAINLEHVSRLYVESTGEGAALKAELGGGAIKTQMVQYFPSRAAALEALREIMEKREAGAAVVRL